MVINLFIKVADATFSKSFKSYYFQLCCLHLIVCSKKINIVVMFSDGKCFGNSNKYWICVNDYVDGDGKVTLIQI